MLINLEGKGIFELHRPIVCKRGKILLLTSVTGKTITSYRNILGGCDLFVEAARKFSSFSFF